MDEKANAKMLSKVVSIAVRKKYANGYYSQQLDRMTERKREREKGWWW